VTKTTEFIVLLQNWDTNLVLRRSQAVSAVINFKNNNSCLKRHLYAKVMLKSHKSLDLSPPFSRKFIKITQHIPMLY